MGIPCKGAGRRIVWYGKPSSGECRDLLEAGWTIQVAGTGQLEHGLPDGGGIALADLRHGSGCEAAALQRLFETHPRCRWVALLPSGRFAEEPATLQVLQPCERLFVEPLNPACLLEALNGFQRPPSLPEADLAEPPMPRSLGQSEVMRRACATLDKYALVDLPVLITGETGTGKEMAARYLHQASTRRAFPFVAINCGALAPGLVHAELFGHERGAFTGAHARRIGYLEAAAGGSVFLDEIGDLPLDAQVNLLRFLQESTLERVGSTRSIKLDVRVLAATHVNLEEAVASGRFREDLYYRLNVLRMRMPALRERGGDVEWLAQQFLERFRLRHPCRARGFGNDARQAMCAYSWPGNVRELLNSVQRAAVMAEGSWITAADLELGKAAAGARPPERQHLPGERNSLIACLRDSQFNVSACARQLKVSRVTLYRLCRKYGVELSELRWSDDSPQNM